MTEYNPQEIRQYYPGYVGQAFSSKASDEDIIHMAKLLDEKARIYNQEILPLNERIKRLWKKYGIRSDMDGVETGGVTMTDKKAVHALLDKILDGGHQGNIEATLATLRVYAETVDERIQLHDLRRQTAELQARIEETERSVLNTLEPWGTA